MKTDEVVNSKANIHSKADNGSILTADDHTKADFNSKANDNSKANGNSTADERYKIKVRENANKSLHVLFQDRLA